MRKTENWDWLSRRVGLARVRRQGLKRSLCWLQRGGRPLALRTGQQLGKFEGGAITTTGSIRITSLGLLPEWTTCFKSGARDKDERCASSSRGTSAPLICSSNCPVASLNESTTVDPRARTGSLPCHTGQTKHESVTQLALKPS